MSNNKNQGVGHLVSIFSIPFIIVGIYFSPNWIVRVLLIIGVVLLFSILWKKVLRK